MTRKVDTRLLKLIRKYNNTPRVLGYSDCNLFFAEVYEPEKYDKIVGKADSVLSFARLCKASFGVTSIDEFLTLSDDYEQLDPLMNRPAEGDLITNGLNVGIVFHDSFFGVFDDVFRAVKLRRVKLTNKGKLFRRTTEWPQL